GITHNVYGRLAIHQLRATLKENKDDKWDLVNVFGGQEPFLSAAGCLKDYGDDNQQRFPQLVLFLSAQGGADGKGAYLVPDGEGGKGAEVVRMDDLLKELSEHIRPDVKKLLVLDVTQAPTNYWPRANPYNEFARALREMDKLGKIEEVP